MHTPDDLKNHGVILGHKKSDFIAGTLPYEVRNPSGDWSPFLTLFERQYYPNFDTMACVSFSANQVCEIQIRHQTGKEVNLSDRFLAKKSGTTQSGNWLYIVADTLRNIGNVLEEEWPALPYDPRWRWEDYYTEIPQFIVNRAKAQFLDKYSLAYETIPVNSAEIAKHLKHAPLQLVIPGHAVAGIALRIDTDTITYFDTYEPGIKTCKVSQLSDVYKLVLTVKGKKQMIGYKKAGDPTTYVAVGSVLVPIADWGAFIALGGTTETVVELTADQFAKFSLASSVLFKLK